MRGTELTLRLPAVLFLLLGLFVLAQAQASPSIQFFMPDGSLPSRELRFTLTTDSGRIETYFTDSKGKFLLTRSLGLKPDAEYRVTMTGDGTSFDTTTHSFKEYSAVYYITVYLNPLRSRPVAPTKVVDLAEFDVRVPEGAKQGYAEAMALFKEGRREEAVRGLERALMIYPDYFRALNDLGVIYMKMNRLDDASRVFERATKIAPRVYHPRLNLGVILTRRGRYKEAVALLDALYRENQSISEVRVALAHALIELDRLDEAEPHLRTALLDLNLDREAAGDAHYRLGLLLNKKEKYEAAAVELSQAAEAIPDSARTHLQLGGALLQLRRLADAERELTTAYRLGGAQLGGAQLMLGQIYFMEKKYVNALSAFEQYLTDVPQAPNAAAVKGVIERIKAALSQK
ncbi:MAG TPA: tetratricopeptide repeat protein [Blastocatellia bacterium]|nr:tetratricopeptide repeat protein [Blastocatellia bacterium]